MNTIALVWGIPPELAYLVVLGVAFAQSAAMPVPGTTTLIAGVVLASQGEVALAPIVASALVGATIGGQVGYLAGRHGGRWAMTRDGRWHDRRSLWLGRGEAFWENHGTKTVVIARLFPVLRHVGGLLAGAHRMPLGLFTVANITGAVVWAAWATTLALVVGEAAGGKVGTLGAIVLAVAVASVVGGAVLRRVLRDSG